jgi:cobalamin 5'-phosphate synthase/cobalamin synthase
MRAALAFLTPLGGARVPDRRTLSWFPVVGAVIGAATGAVWWGASQLWPPVVAAAIVIAFDLAITGMLHLDGLVDTADGLLGHLERDRRLAVMAEPTVGAFAVATAVVVLLLRFSALATMVPSVALVAGLWCGSRTVMAVAARAVPYARAGGLVSAFTGGDWRPVAIYGTAAALLLGALGQGAPGIGAVAASLVAGALVVLAGRARLGGCTGDILGAAGVLAETAGLVVAAARW